MKVDFLIADETFILTGAKKIAGSEKPFTDTERMENNWHEWKPTMKKYSRYENTILFTRIKII